MRPVKWEKVKLEAQRIAQVNYTGSMEEHAITSYERPAIVALLEGVIDETYDWRGNLKQLQELVWERIENWDIRCVKGLHALFPGCLPRNCRYVVDYDKNGNLTIFE